ncbi:antitoxin MazE family protein [Candidatus Binatia bacterium]|nr:antitoxin MazE family protein [Candidatus Binatia bacterium]
MPSVSKRTARTRKPISAREKVRVHRERLRAQGLRPVQVWLPDTRSPEFAAEASRQSRRVGSSRYAATDQAFIDAISTGDEE